MKKHLFLPLLLLFTVKTVTACPMCTSPTATQVRNYLFGPELPFNLFALVLPFLFFALVAACIYYYDLPFSNKRL